MKLRLVDRDYAILRSYDQRSGFATFISIVVQRMALDYRIHTWGKWHASAEAKRRGPLAVELDRLLHRDGRTLDESLLALSSKHPDVTRESLQALAESLPTRPPRHRDVNLDEAESVAGTHGGDVEERLLAKERRSASEHLSATMAGVIAKMPEEDRVILQLRFEGGMAVSQIARAFGLDQKLLYRRLEKLMHDMRGLLERSGVAARDALDLIGRDESHLEFSLGNLPPRPSIRGNGTLAGDSETSQ